MGEDRFTSQVMLCWPSDRTLIAWLNRLLPVGEKFSPSVEHSLSTCDSCRRGIWIGMQQRQLVQSPFLNARKLCILCANKLNTVLGLDPQAIDISFGTPPPQSRTA